MELINIYIFFINCLEGFFTKMTIDRVSSFILIPMSEQRMKWVIEEKAYRFDFCLSSCLLNTRKK